jgi:hypothetical protein
VATGDGDATTERPGAERLGIVAARRILDLIQDFGFAFVQAEPQRSVALDGALVAAERFRGQGLPEILQREEMVTEAIRAYISDGDVMAVAA